MKKIVMLCLVALFGLGISGVSAQKKGEAALKTVVFVTDLHCDQCAKKINNSIPFVKGVKEVKVDVPTKRVTVTYDTAKNDEAGLVKAFKKIKVNAEAEAEPEKKK